MKTLCSVQIETVITYPSPNVIRIITKRSVWWVGHVADPRQVRISDKTSAGKNLERRGHLAKISIYRSIIFA
jgi:hypothetical protein